MWFKDSLANMRNSKKHRIGFLIIFIIILAVCAYFFEKVRWMFIGLIILLLGALGLQVIDYDIDLGTLMETKSLTESRVENVTDSDGNSYSVVTGTCNREDFDLNCADFDTQGQAQDQYQQCVDAIWEKNPSIDLRKLDIYGLDGDNDGIVCEALPAA